MDIPKLSGLYQLSSKKYANVKTLSDTYEVIGNAALAYYFTYWLGVATVLISLWYVCYERCL